MQGTFIIFCSACGVTSSEQTCMPQFVAIISNSEHIPNYVQTKFYKSRLYQSLHCPKIDLV